MSRVLVFGATGQQGGAVVRALLEIGEDVVAFVRQGDGEDVERLHRSGVQTLTGDLGDPESIAAALEGVDAVFAVTTPFAGLAAEIQHGRNIADAVAAAGTPHIVYSSVAGAPEGTGIGHFDSKWVIEQYMTSVGLRPAVVAPVFFMNNYLFPDNLSDISGGVLRQSLAEDVPLQMIESGDIGRFAALMLINPEQFAGVRVEIAGDERKGPDLAAVIGAALGREVRYEVQPAGELDAMGGDWRRMYEWFGEGGFSVDRQDLQRRFPDFLFTSLEEFAAAQEWKTPAAR